MNKGLIGIIVALVVIIGVIMGLILLNHKPTSTSPSSTQTTSPSIITTTSTGTANSSTTTSSITQTTVQPNQSVIIFYKHNNTYYVFLIPYTNSSGPVLPNITWWDIVNAEVVYYERTYIRATPISIGFDNITFDVLTTPQGKPFYKLSNGYAMVFAQLYGNYTFTKGEVYKAYIGTPMGIAIPITVEYE
ncbi:hypothetical protein J5U23_02903 [Saccharolobus shibatae B12]|uniref:Uncharacterized protein n=1 Tax=Saccharolobus shibatae (strain ATCC 51178 / DSM 5389 / JCM 8931 / NBRC 15437 / B12) TaxID=523848 RepID=A0A8F5GRR9_SACSH|nr:hypothetical protein [Saccharolobus shibatae]QXJ27121.1 hypothetical protein J5U23_p2903 [Saccharolobus shibatae B12]QXJ30014.1 hypothetical protein J5U23_02903 [Saccharolobus shibatae B12]